MLIQNCRFRESADYRERPYLACFAYFPDLYFEALKRSTWAFFERFNRRLPVPLRSEDSHLKNCSIENLQAIRIIMFHTLILLNSVLQPVILNSINLGWRSISKSFLSKTMDRFGTIFCSFKSLQLQIFAFRDILIHTFVPIFLKFHVNFRFFFNYNVSQSRLSRRLFVGSSFQLES